MAIPPRLRLFDPAYRGWLTPERTEMIVGLDHLPEGLPTNLRLRIIAQEIDTNQQTQTEQIVIGDPQVMTVPLPPFHHRATLIMSVESIASDELVAELRADLTRLSPEMYARCISFDSRRVWFSLGQAFLPIALPVVLDVDPDQTAKQLELARNLGFSVASFLINTMDEWDRLPAMTAVAHRLGMAVWLAPRQLTREQAIDLGRKARAWAGVEAFVVPTFSDDIIQSLRRVDATSAILASPSSLEEDTRCQEVAINSVASWASLSIRQERTLPRVAVVELTEGKNSIDQFTSVVAHLPWLSGVQFSCLPDILKQSDQTLKSIETYVTTLNAYAPYYRRGIPSPTPRLVSKNESSVSLWRRTFNTSWVIGVAATQGLTDAQQVQLEFGLSDQLYDLVTRKKMPTQEGPGNSRLLTVDLNSKPVQLITNNPNGIDTIEK